MEIKKNAKQKRDSLQQLIYKIIDPVVAGLIKIGFTPNAVTTTGFVGTAIAAALFIAAGCIDKTPSYGLIALGGVLLLFASLFDMLDGQVARIGNMSSRFGALYDSVLDRYSELVSVGGIAFMMINTGYVAGGIITFLALVGSVMVSYVRARAEGLDIECKIGFMQRPERVVLTSVAALVCGLCGVCFPKFDAMIILIIAMAIIAIFANITAFARVALCRRELSNQSPKA